MQLMTSVLLLLSLGIFAAVHSFPHVENVSTEHGNETAKQLVLSPQEVYLLQLQQKLQQQQNVALAEANRKLLLQQGEIDDSDEEDDDPFSRSAIPEDSSEIFPERTRNDKDEEDVVYAIVDHGDDEVREAAEGNTDSTAVPAAVVTVAPAPAETATTHYVNVPASDQPSSANTDEPSSNSLTENGSVSTNMPPEASSISPGVPSSTSVAPESAASNAPEAPAVPGSPESAPTSNVTSASTPASGATLSTPAPSGVSTPSAASTISSSPTPDSPVNPNLASSTAAVPSSNVSSGATTPSSNVSSSATTPSSINLSTGANEASASTSSTTKKPSPQRPPYRANLKCRCGTQTTRKLYIGSTRVNTNTYPWTVSVTRNGTHMCTGSIINSKYVLTSASCLKGASPKDLLVRAALSNPSKQITYNVNSVSYHPGYKAQGLANNLALVEVQEDIKPSKNVKFVCLPLEEQRDSDCGTIVSVSEDRGSKNLTMVQQQVRKISASRCSTLLRKPVDKNDTFCTAPPSRYCGGDTGGSYITPGKGYSFTLRGLVNSSSGCKTRRQPAVFTNVRRYTSWILYKSQSGSYCKVPSFRRELLKLPE